jgi:hypothetical protein
VSGRHWHGDEDLFADLTSAWREVAPTAATLTTRAHAAFSWRTVEDDLLLASLHFDSATEPAGATRAAAGAGPRILVFTSSPLTVELEVLPDQIVGQLVPPAVADIVVEAGSGESVEVRSDERGFFLVAPLPEGPLRLRCDTATGRLVTDWVTL